MEVVGLPVVGRMVLDVLVGQVSLQPGFADFANQCASGLFRQQGFGRTAGGQAQEQCQQRTVVTVPLRDFVPHSGGRSIKVVDITNRVVEPEVAPHKSRCLFELFVG